MMGLSSITASRVENSGHTCQSTPHSWRGRPNELSKADAINNMIWRVETKSWARAAADAFMQALFLAAAILLPGMTEPSFSHDACDGKIEAERGEDPGPFFGVDLWLYSVALAEMACGAPKISKPAIMRIVAEKGGCGPDTEMHQLLQDAAKKWENGNLRTLAEDSLPHQQLTDAQIRDWADETVAQIGGCGPLLDFHERLAESLASRP
jgi:hypothetical protein